MCIRDSIYEDVSADRSASPTGSQEEDGNLLSLSQVASPNAIEGPGTSSFSREQDVSPANDQQAIQTPVAPAAFGSGTATGPGPCPSLFQHASAHDDVVGDVQNLFSAFEPTTTIEHARDTQSQPETEFPNSAQPCDATRTPSGVRRSERLANARQLARPLYGATAHDAKAHDADALDYVTRGEPTSPVTSSASGDGPPAMRLRSCLRDTNKRRMRERRRVTFS